MTSTSSLGTAPLRARHQATPTQTKRARRCERSATAKVVAWETLTPPHRLDTALGSKPREPQRRTGSKSTTDPRGPQRPALVTWPVHSESTPVTGPSRNKLGVQVQYCEGCEKQCSVVRFVCVLLGAEESKRATDMFLISELGCLSRVNLTIFVFLSNVV